MILHILVFLVSLLTFGTVSIGTVAPAISETSCANCVTITNFMPLEELNNHTLNEVFVDGFYSKTLPNGVKDEITDGYKVQKVKAYTLQSADITVIDVLTEWLRIGVTKPTDYIGYNNYTSYVGSLYTNDFIYTVYVDSAVHIGKYSTTFFLFRFNFGVPLGTYANLAATKAALAGTVIYYQLATPIITEIGGNITLSVEQMDFWYSVYSGDTVVFIDTVFTPEELTRTDAFFLIAYAGFWSLCFIVLASAFNINLKRGLF